MRILFVDDEPRILSGIRRMLFHLMDKWDIHCATSGQEALDVLGTMPFDVVVTDMRMPGMDGAALLSAVHERYPDIVRIVLSGYSELEASLRAVPVAHQFLSKPCQADVLESVVVRACALQEMLSDAAIKSAVGRIDSLPSVPSIYAALTSELTDPDANAQRVGDLVQSDPAMCAKILQLVNSSFFFRSKSCTDIKQAIVRLGFGMVKNLVLSISIFNTIDTCDTPDFDIETLQAHSLKVAAEAAKRVARAQMEDAFAAGILHDVGKLVVASVMPEEFAASLSLASTEGIPLWRAERAVYGTTHAELGAHLLGLWGLPNPIVEAVANHHSPERVPYRESAEVLEAVIEANEAGSNEEVAYGAA